LRRSFLKHLTGGGPKAIGDRFSAKHSRQLVHPPLDVESLDGGTSPPPFHALVDLKVRVGISSNLRKMGNAEDLKRRPEPTELAPDDIGHSPSDAGVNFVKY
jgi:hypothetical protein